MIKNLPKLTEEELKTILKTKKPWEAGLKPLREVERNYIIRVLMSVKGHKINAAKILGIGRTTLDRKIEECANKYDIYMPLGYSSNGKFVCFWFFIIQSSKKFIYLLSVV